MGAGGRRRRRRHPAGPGGRGGRAGNELRVPYDRAVVQGAPGLEPGGRLWPQEEAELYAYYGLAYTGASLVDLDEDDDEEPLEEPDAFVARGGRWPDLR